MATRAQIEANRRNSKLSSGPRDTSLTRFNGLKHGLCAVEVGLPGEDPAEVQAEFDGWRDDWQPMTHTRAVLVDLAAVATWRLRRSIRARVRRPRPPRRRRRTRLRLRSARRRRARHRPLRRRPRRALPARVQRPGHRPPAHLLGRAGRGPGGRPVRLGPAVPPAAEDPAGPPPRHPPVHRRGGVPIASARLLAARSPAPKPLPKGEAEATVASLRRTAAEAMARLRERRKAAPDPAPARRRAMEAATADTSHELRLIHRYEMDHERSLRWAAAAVDGAGEVRRPTSPSPNPRLKSRGRRWSPGRAGRDGKTGRNS